MRPNPINRPTLADFGVMLADKAREYGIICAPDNSMNDSETADNVITTLAGITEDLAGFYINHDYLNALMDVVNYYAVAADMWDKKEKAERAHKALAAFIGLYNLITNYRPELWQYTNAANEYARAQCSARADENHRKEEAKATDEPETATAPKEGAETHKPETMTDNTPKR